MSDKGLFLDKEFSSSKKLAKTYRIWKTGYKNYEQL